MRHLVTGLLLTLWCGWLSGCGPPANPEQLRVEVLRADPSFSTVLEKRDEQANRIKLLEHELDLKRNQIERQMTQLRQELNDSRMQVDQKIQRIKALLKPDLEHVDLALSMAIEERQAKRSQRASLGRSISRLRNALKQNSPTWTQTERTRMDRELAALLAETQRLGQEIASLNEHIRLLKIKRLLLRV